MKLHYLFAFLFLLVLIPAVSSYQQNFCVDIKEASNSSALNMTSLNYPDSTTILTNKQMTKNGFLFNFTTCQTSQTGTYKYIICDNAGVCTQKSFLVTSNGQDQPSGIVIVFFSILFIFSMFSVVYTVIDMIGNVFSIDYSIWDMSKSIGVYFGLLAVQLLQNDYLGNTKIQEWISTFIQIGLWTNVILPLFSFVFLLIVGSWIKQKIMQRKENAR